ncbi:hypothetical protein BH11ARM1_BH11ARM1_15850 [soil metagenome]
MYGRSNVQIWTTKTDTTARDYEQEREDCEKQYARCIFKHPAGISNSESQDSSSKT